MLKTKIAFAVMSGAALLVCADLGAAPAAGTDLDYVKRLNDEEMADYSIYLLQKMLAKNPADADKLKIEMASSFIALGQFDKANEILLNIKPDNKFYPYAQITIGKGAIQKGNFDEGIDKLKKYFDTMIPKIKAAPPDAEGEKEFRYAVGLLKFAYEQKKDPAKAAEAVELIKNLKSTDSREVKLYGQISMLDSAEKMMAGKAADSADFKAGVAMIDKTLPEFEQLMWGGVDAITMTALVMRGRAYFLQGKHKEAIKELDYNPEVFDEFDEAFQKQGNLAQAPGAEKRLWLGKSHMALADKSADRKEKIDNYVTALKKYVAILKKFPGYGKSEEAYANMMLCKEHLEKVTGKPVQLPAIAPPTKSAAKAAVVEVKIPEEAEQLFKEKKFDKVLPIVEKPLVSNRFNKGASDVFYKTAMTYLNLNEPLSAMSLAMHMAEVCPEAPLAPVGLLQIGEALWKANSKADALLMYETYLAKMPAHQFGGEIATIIAKDKFDTAKAVADETNKLAGEEQMRKIKQASDLFKASLPYYDRVIKSYGNRRNLVEAAYYMMANAYNACKMYPESAQTYLKYCEYETEDKAKLAGSKLAAADNYLKGGQQTEKDIKDLKDAAAEAQTEELKKKRLDEAAKMEKDVKEYFKEAAKNASELLAWMGPNGKVGASSDPKMRKIEENAFLVLGFAYDYGGEKKKSIESLQEYVKKYPSSENIPACMSRIGNLFYSLGDIASSTRTFEELAQKYPNSKEAKNAYFDMGKNLYETNNFTQCFQVFNKIFAENLGISVSGLRWAAANLPNCGGNHPPEGAELALKACVQLLAKIKAPDLPEWVGDDYARELKGDEKKKKDALDLIKQKILLDAGYAAFYKGDYVAAQTYLSELLEFKDTPYFFKGRFCRADAYMKSKQYDKARNDLNEVSRMAIGSKKNSIATKANYLIGDSYLTEGNFEKAFASFSVISNMFKGDEALKGMISPSLSDEAKKELEKELEAEMEWIELAVYKGAFAAAKLGRTKERDEFAAKYKKFFPKGVYLGELDKLPAPDAANKAKQ